MGRKIAQPFVNLKVNSVKQLLNKALNTTITLQGEIPETIDLTKVFAVSAIFQQEDGKFFRKIFLDNGQEHVVELNLVKVNPALVELTDTEQLKQQITKFKETKVK